MNTRHLTQPKANILGTPDLNHSGSSRNVRLSVDSPRSLHTLQPSGKKKNNLPGTLRRAGELVAAYSRHPQGVAAPAYLSTFLVEQRKVAGREQLPKMKKLSPTHTCSQPAASKRPARELNGCVLCLQGLLHDIYRSAVSALPICLFVSRPALFITFSRACCLRVALSRPEKHKHHQHTVATTAAPLRKNRAERHLRAGTATAGPSYSDWCTYVEPNPLQSISG